MDSAKNWEMYFYDMIENFNIVNLIGEKEIKSKLYDGLIYGDRV